MPQNIELAVTVDVEDWFHVCAPHAPHPAQGAWRVLENVRKILLLLETRRARGTFFVLGSVAEALPSLVPLLKAAGHEIASHGYSHRLVTELGPDAFREEVRRTREILERQSGCSVKGFRAPRWSICRKKTPWALEILREEGYVYDSSLNPLPYVGDPEGPLDPAPLRLAAGTLWEVPPMVTS
ncbi:MAG TPA: polysaccharide deacetylase family protein, partial [Verrucomicrobiae bacterium]|nr:polysaccharide deacetylase family protein [Verrucomicrobiae bacterium]